MHPLTTELAGANFDPPGRSRSASKSAKLELRTPGQAENLASRLPYEEDAEVAARRIRIGVTGSGPKAVS